MHRPTFVRSSRRLGVLTAAAFAVAVATAGPAAAHAEVEAEGARALDQNVDLTFSAESESASAGITKLEVILPKGITPADLTYKKGPDGWKFTPTARGYTVSGAKLPVGEDVEYVVTVRQLPDAKSLAFKTLQSYSDGNVDRWIELEEEAEGDGHGHGHPAPRLDLKAAAPGAEVVSPTPSEEPTTAAPSPEPSAKTSAPSAQAAADSPDDGGGSPAVPLAIGAAVVLALGGGVWWLRSRKGGTA
ncbi:DUF1775 domain-containing protein [Streptomyces stelliscabiei]|uniref:DUF1775 domain-containing protein n=1 Tax=Streptomyces stelliscabiei TaxID=146820 RepID=UPI0029A11440|nr:DUF1775 domain-containing protein [Streptomyces stelliscabiei]MDX2551042.1 DUF1775 domain-containing protein [Streptomyces stelliscabiei]MDX2614829.1 DUF1775 domain-containing protein [Streptomyces stelliscabiei]MDX2635571.1 DUF1775 domain-containing protein [Streptomyces stelliscabiei]MDX2666166.1 DUF1775 domain-containing protein [Streptomyces stelliscabiei]MDX2717185.1 DUF1775 domain-containing protein [Streptomyces stelliscabiei]